MICEACGSEHGCVECATAGLSLKLKRAERDREDAVHTLGLLRTDSDKWLDELRSAMLEIVEAGETSRFPSVFGLQDSFRAWSENHFG